MRPERHSRLLTTYPKHCLRVMFGIFMFGLFANSSILAQDHLYVEKPPFKRKKVEVGDSVRVQIKGYTSNSMLGYRYQGAKGDSLYLSGGAFHVDEFEKFWVHRPRNSRYWLSMLASGGITLVVIFPPLMLLDALTSGNGFQRSDWRRIRNSIASGLAIFFFFKRLAWKRYKIGEKWLLKVRPPVENSVLPDRGGQPQSPIEKQ